MKKVLSVFVLVLLLVGVVGCKEKPVERTFKADGTYMVWELNTSTADVLNEDGTVYKIGEGDAAQSFKSVTPVLSTVSVTIANDKIIKYEIDERQSKPYVKTVNAENGTITALTWIFNNQTKRELKYGYGMETRAAQGEWFQTILNLERAWLKDEPKALASVTITHENYVEMAKEAIKNAKDGKAAYIYPGEHYTYDVAYAKANVSETGRLSNVTFDAHIFGYSQVAAEVYNATTKTFDFKWAEKSKYDSYGNMSREPGVTKLWQDQIDTIQDYIEENGFDGSLTTSGAANKHKGFHIANEVPSALASVTVQVHGEMTALNGLAEFFPYGWDK